MTGADPNDPLGYDVLVGGPDDDLDPSGRDATGIELVDADIVHRLTTDTIDLIDAPNGRVDFGRNIRLWVGEAITADDAAAKAPIIDEVLHRIEGIAFTRVAVNLAPPGTSMSVGADATLLIDLTYGTTTGETLSRTLGVSGVSVEFLSQGT